MTDFKTTDRDVNRAIRSWLREDRHEDVSRIAGAVLDQVETTPQRRSTWWPARRTPTMNKIAGFGLAAAAVVVIALIGSQLIGSPGTPAEPAPERPIARAVRRRADANCRALAVDRRRPSRGQQLHAHQRGDVPITATIPAPGWAQDPGGILVKDENGAAPDGAYVIGVWATADPLIPSDPCQWESTMPDTPATTLDEIVAALGEPGDTKCLGRGGRHRGRVCREGDHHRDAGWPVHGQQQPRLRPGQALHVGLRGATACQMWFQEAGQIDELWIVDVDGEFFFVPGSYYSETPASVVDELGAFLGSMTFGE